MEHEPAKADSSLPSVANREGLIYLLTEAAELEHGLLCSYLFAAFSLKRGASDLSVREARAVAGWRASIAAVAMEEMVHLALVQNLLAALGAAPHMQRPNFPVEPGFYPSGVVLRLTRFNAETLDHFVFLERPEDAELADATRFAETADYVRPQRLATVTPSAQDYATVGALYRGIEHGFEHLAATMGEARLFVGDPAAQVGPSLLELDGLHTVTDLTGVRRAVGRIIEQGEGGRREHDASHFARFTRMRAQFESLRGERPDFDPAHPVVSNPVMNAPAHPELCVHVEARDARVVLDLANAAYALMVQLLACFFCATGGHAGRKTLVDAAVRLMVDAVGPLAEMLATLPVSDAKPGRTAGMSFTLPRSVHALPRERPAMVLLHERAVQLADACDLAEGELLQTSSGIAIKLRRVAHALAPAR